MEDLRICRAAVIFSVNIWGLRDWKLLKYFWSQRLGKEVSSWNVSLHWSGKRPCLRWRTNTVFAHVPLRCWCEPTRAQRIYKKQTWRWQRDDLFVLSAVPLPLFVWCFVDLWGFLGDCFSQETGKIRRKKKFWRFNVDLKLKISRWTSAIRSLPVENYISVRYTSMH